MTRRPEKQGSEYWYDVGSNLLKKLHGLFDPLFEDTRDEEALRRQQLGVKGVDDALLDKSPSSEDPFYMEGYKIGGVYEGSDKSVAQAVLGGMLRSIKPVYVPKSFLDAAKRVERERQS